MCPIICTLILRSFNRIDYITYKGFLKKAQAAPQRPTAFFVEGGAQYVKIKREAEE